MQLLTERHSDQIAGVLSCDDRILVQGTLPTFCYAQGIDGLSVRARHPRFRLSSLRSAATGPTAGQRPALGPRERVEHRVPPQSELP